MSKGKVVSSTQCVVTHGVYLNSVNVACDGTNTGRLTLYNGTASGDATTANRLWQVEAATGESVAITFPGPGNLGMEFDTGLYATLSSLHSAAFCYSDKGA